MYAQAVPSLSARAPAIEFPAVCALTSVVAGTSGRTAT